MLQSRLNRSCRHFLFDVATSFAFKGVVGKQCKLLWSSYGTSPTDYPVLNDSASYYVIWVTTQTFPTWQPSGEEKVVHFLHGCTHFSKGLLPNYFKENDRSFTKLLSWFTTKYTFAHAKPRLPKPNAFPRKAPHVCMSPSVFPLL